MDTTTIETMTFAQMLNEVDNLYYNVVEQNRCSGERRMSKWLDNQDVCQMLGITKRTLQSYRERGAIPYSQVGNKIYYRAEDVKRAIDRQRKEAKQ